MKIRGVSIFKPKGHRKAGDPYKIAYGFGSSRKVITASTDYADTFEFAKRLSKLAQASKINVSDPTELRREVQRRRPLSAHLNDWEKEMKARGQTGRHALRMRLYAEQCIDDVVSVDAIVLSSVHVKIAGLGGSSTTRNRRAYAVERFLRWGATDNRWPREIAERIKIGRLPHVRVRKRRILELDELAKLIDTARNGDSFGGMLGTTRALLYRTMLASGLRFGEVRRIMPEHLLQNVIHLPANLTKNRKEARITLPRELMKEIRQWSSGLWIGPIFQVTKFNPERLLKHDLKAAGIQRQTPEGVFDMHSFRHQCATLLASTGAPPKVIQAHLRHSSIKLTMDTYGHLFDHDRTRVAEIMGQIFEKRHDKRNTPARTEQMPKIEWSHRESNPDLLNAIQTADELITLARNELHDKRGRRIAPVRAQRLLRRLFVRAGRGRK